MSLWLLALSASLAAPAQAQDYPTRPVKIISDSAPGSAVDVTLRMVADRLGQVWGQQVLPVNQPGGGGVISARAAAEAAPDGYTLYMPALSVFLPAPGKAPNTALELPRDFAPIGSVTEQPMFIAAAPSLGVTTLPELIALAKQRPGEISYAVTGVGTRTVVSAKLRLYCTNPSGFGGDFRTTTSGWSEGTVTWNTAPAAGATSLATLGSVTSGVWYEVNVTGAVAADGTASFRVVSPSTDGAWYSSKEGTSGFAPQLVVSVA